jgi:hypothetical protein
MNKWIKGAIAAVITVITILGGFIAIDSHYVTHAFHEICETRNEEKLEHQELLIAGVQKEIAVQRAQDAVYFWTRIEMEFYKA